MSLIIRKDGRIFCAAKYPKEPGDTYIDDDLHYILSVEKKVIVSEDSERHKISGQWWWIGNIPDGVVIDSFFME